MWRRPLSEPWRKLYTVYCFHMNISYKHNKLFFILQLKNYSLFEGMLSSPCVLCLLRWLWLRSLDSSVRSRETLQTRISTTCLNCWSSVTAALAKPPSCSGTQTTLLPPPSSAPWASTSKSKPLFAKRRGSSYRSGWDKKSRFYWQCQDILTIELRHLVI